MKFELSAYIPIDRCHALARGVSLPDRTTGAALFADISGFTPLTEALTRELGPQRGAEELTRHLDVIYTALIVEVERYQGAVIAFSGDAITCWFDGDPTAPDQAALRAIACALGMQAVMRQFHAVTTPSGGSIMLAVKIGVAAGPVRRFQIGDPQIQLIDALAGVTLDRLAEAESVAAKGEIVVSAEALAELDDAIVIAEWRQAETNGRPLAVVQALARPVAPTPWPPLPLERLEEAQLRPWLLPRVYQRLQAGQSQLLAELRSAVAIFVRFEGIDYDDETAHERLDAYIQWVQRIVTRYDGALFQLSIGDKGSYFYCVFGAPQAHEDDAARAAQATLALCNPPASLDFVRNIKIGVSQGQMRTGAYGSTTRRTYGVLGDEVNVAARLMQAAPPGHILASYRVQRNAADGFDWEPLPPLQVKGKAEPLTVFRLVAARAQRELPIHSPHYGLPLVGRTAELALIRRLMTQAVGGQGQIIAIVADAGMGKSRLVAESIHLAYDQGMRVFSGECQSYGANDGYLVWENIWQSFFGVNRNDSPQAQIETLEARLAALDPTLLPRLPLLGSVLNLAIPDNELTSSLDARLRKISLESLLVACLRASARANPLLLALEDCQWMDPLSHDLLELVGRAIFDLPVLIIVAFRPPEAAYLQAPRITRLPHTTEITLTELAQTEAAELIALKQVHLGMAAELPDAVVEQIVARTNGNPFYIEEFLNYLHDRGLAPQDAAAFARLDLPPNLSSLILSRIDQLSERQQATLKVASVIGRLFRAAWLWGVYPELGEPEQVRFDLDLLDRMELTVLDQPEPDSIYLFKHILTHGVAYETLPYATRAWLHGQLGAFIEQTYPQTLDQFVDLLAFHYDHSPNEAKRREYLRKAGEAAQEAYANPAAIDYYQRLLPLLPDAERGPVLLRLGQVFELVGQWDAASDCYSQALELAEQSGDRQEQARCQSAMGILLRRRGDYAAALTWLDRARAGFAALDDLAGVSQTLEATGEVYRLTGEYAQARDHYAESFRLAEGVTPPEQSMALRATALKGAGTLALLQGDYATARMRYEESLALLRALGDKPVISSILSNLGVVARREGDHAAAQTLYAESLAMGREMGDLWGSATCLGNLGMVARSLRDYRRAVALYEECLSIYRGLGERNFTALTLNNLGDVLMDQGDYAGAHRLYEESMTIQRELGDRWAIAYLLEAFGGLAAVQAQPERALRLVAAAAALRQEIGAPLSSAEQEQLERMLEPLRQMLGTAVTREEEQAGQAMTLDQAIAYAFSA